MKKNRLLSLFLALVMLFGVVSALGASAMAADEKLDTPYGWFETDRSIRWKLVSGPSSNKYNVDYTVVGYYSIDGSVGKTEAFSFTVRIYTGLANPSAAWSEPQQFRNFISFKDGYAQIDSFAYYTFLNIYNSTIDRDKLKLWFTVRASAEGSTNTVSSETFTSDSNTGTELRNKIGTLPPGTVSIDNQSPSNGSWLRYIRNGDVLIIPKSKLKAQWQKSTNGTSGWTNVPEYDEGVYTVGSDDVDKYIRVILTADGYTGQLISDPVHVKKESLTGSVTISPSSPHAGDTLTANLSGAAASITANKIHYQWQKDMSEDGGFYRDIAGETNKTFNIPLTDTSGYSKYRVKVTADGYDGELRSDSVRVVEGQPPLTGTVTVTPSSPKAGDTLTADFTGTLATLPAYKIHYQWQFSAGEGAVWKDIAAGTSRDYTTASNTPTGRNYRVMVTADGYDGAVYSNVVILSNPLTGTVTISPASPKTGDTLTANPGGGLTSIPASRYHYQWQRYVKVSGVKWGYRDIPDATDRTYSGDEPAGRQIRVKITADGYDGAVYSELVTYASGGSSYPKGDVDRSGQVGNSDLIMVARHVVHIITLTGEQFTLGDMDNDKVIDNKDIISVARKVVGL